MATVVLHLPPLRERAEDIPFLAEAFVAEAAERFGVAARRFDAEAHRALLDYSWPGNVRELQNAIERAVVLASGAKIACRDLPTEVRGGAVRNEAPTVVDPELTLSEAVDAFKADRIRWALEQSDGNQTRAAERLGMRQSNLSRLMKSLGLK